MWPICRVDRMPEPTHHEGRVFARGAVMTGLTHRQSEILNIARAFGRVMVEDLAKRFEVSAQTIRKDLNDLCDHRSLTRIHGGAIIASGVENLAYEARRFVAADDIRTGRLLTLKLPAARGTLRGLHGVLPYAFTVAAPLT